MRRVMVIGLDCAPPALCFERLRARMPNLSALIRRGAHGPLRSVAPPITVPAWACMVSGRDPGELGLYGFRNRVPGSYALTLPDARALEGTKRVWDLLSDAGRRVAVLYVPLTSPPSPVHGTMLGCFLAQGGPTASPPTRGLELEARFGPHAPDVGELRHGETDALLDALHETARQHFAIARHLWTEEKPELLMMVEMGTDRLHHAMWRHLDPTHPEHDPRDPRVREAADYYAFLDAELGALVELADDETAILVVSDHGARTMQGALRINEWLIAHGWLTLKGPRPTAPTALTEDLVDWSRTRAWGEGGYYARVFLNARGREPLGIVEDLEAETLALARALEAMPGPDGAPLGVRAHRPRDLYRAANGLPPDLLVFLRDLDYRALGTIGGPLFARGDDRGPADGCNHDWEGIYVAAGAGITARGRLEGLSIHDVGPTLLGLLGVPTPAGWLGADRAAG